MTICNRRGCTNKAVTKRKVKGMATRLALCSVHLGEAEDDGLIEDEPAGQPEEVE